LIITKRFEDKREVSRRADRPARDSPVKGTTPPRATGDWRRALEVTEKHGNCQPTSGNARKRNSSRSHVQKRLSYRVLYPSYVYVTFSTLLTKYLA
jgi:hypothetical protein